MLIIDDDARVRGFIVEAMRQLGHVVDEADNGETGLHLGLDEAYDVMVVDRLLPGRSGLDIVRLLREAEVRTPVLMLTALGGVDDRVAGLTAGADDYLVKPFAVSELTARINALNRRPPLVQRQTRHRIGDLDIDLEARRVVRDSRVIELTPQEFKLLDRLARNPGHVVTRTMLLESLWGVHFDPKANLIDAHVSRLRSKIDRGFETELIRTVRGVGYVLGDAK